MADNEHTPDDIRFVEVDPWHGWTHEEIENEILGGPAVVLRVFDEDED